MNCKEGDLAIVTRSINGNAGIIVRCIALHPAGCFTYEKSLGPMWEVDRELTFVSWAGSVKLENFAPDACLRPIRDQPGEDQSIQWAGLPGELEIPVQEVSA